MAIDFSFPPDLEALRLRVREFIDTVVRPTEDAMDEHDRDELVAGILKMRKAAHEWGLWLPHMPKEWGGMGLGHVAMAAVSAEAAKSRYGPIARTEDAPEIPQAGNSAFLVDLPAPGWEIVRDVETMSGGHNHCEIRIRGLRVPANRMLGGRAQGHLLGQARLGPARLAHCMRWLGQAEMALDMMVDRATKRFAHGSLLSEKQGIQWMIADSAMELYQAKLMVLHAAYLIDEGADFRSEVSMAKHFVANMLGRVIDRAIQVHGALGYSTDTPLAQMATQARWARFADGADEVHQWRIAQRTIDAYQRDGSTRGATGDLPL